jgi:hypothetical protein
MAVKSGPLLIQDGLILAFDAAVPRSYSGSGTTVNGLVEGIGVTLNNGVGFGTTGTSYFIFDGVNDNIPFSLPTYGSTLSIEMWSKIKLFSGGMIFGFNLYDVWTSGGAMGFNTASSDQYGLTSTQVTNLNLLNQWKHYVFEMRSDVKYTNNKIYINGQNQSLSQVLSTENASNRNFNSGNGRISSWLFDNNYYIPMDLAQFRVYNRSLSAQEVLQNYNASKKRYGL